MINSTERQIAKCKVGQLSLAGETISGLVPSLPTWALYKGFVHLLPMVAVCLFLVLVQSSFQVRGPLFHFDVVVVASSLWRVAEMQQKERLFPIHVICAAQRNDNR